MRCARTLRLRKIIDVVLAARSRQSLVVDRWLHEMRSAVRVLRTPYSQEEMSLFVGGGVWLREPTD